MNNHLEELKIGGRPMTKNEIKIKELQQENKQLKEIIEKAKEFLNTWKCFECEKGTIRELSFESDKQSLLDILKADDK